MLKKVGIKWKYSGINVFVLEILFFPRLMFVPITTRWSVMQPKSGMLHFILCHRHHIHSPTY